MKHWAKLSRGGWLVMAAWLIVACGGGGTGSTAGAPGTGGTGVYAMGSISGFGSVIVNGIKFDDLQASVQVDGVMATSADLRLGMVASVQGVRGGVATLGTASSIEAWSIARGPVTQTQGVVIPGAIGQFTVAGMTVQTDSATVFDFLGATTPLPPGLGVAVWGLQSGADGRSWRATRVATVTGTTVVSSGFISVAGSQRSLNGLVLSGSAAGNLKDKQLVRVQGTLSSVDQSLVVASVQQLGAGVGSLQQGEAEIEGLVTSMLSASHFMLGNIQVDASNASVSPSTAQITLGARVEVEGQFQAGVLKATKVEIENAQTLGEVEIEAPIEQFISLGNFVVRGQRCDATNATISHGTVADLKVGARVHLKGVKAGDVVTVTELELVH